MRGFFCSLSTFAFYHESSAFYHASTLLALRKERGGGVQGRGSVRFMIARAYCSWEGGVYSAGFSE